MTNRMVGSVLTLLTLLFSAGGGAAQTYTQMQWGMNKGVTPYAFGANINGAWYNLGTVSSTGIWNLPSSNIGFTQNAIGAVPYTVQAKLQQYLSVKDFGATGNGSDDDGPAFRTALAACMASGYQSLYIPIPPVGYNIRSLDPSGKGALVIGDGQKLTQTYSITSGTKVLTATSGAPFTAAMVSASIDVPGAGAAGGGLLSTVASYQSPTQITLTDNAQTTLSSSSQTIQVGHSNTCNLIGEATNPTGNYLSLKAGSSLGANITLGPGLNRPLIYVTTKVATPTIENIWLQGNGTNQTGWAGGPNGKLYTVQAEDGSAWPESAVTFINSVVTGGYNGNFYLGSARGAGYANDTLFLYTADVSATDANVFLNGYDYIFNGPQIGNTASATSGYGMFIAQGTQYQIINGAIFSNTVGIGIGAGVNYINVSGTHIGYNYSNGMQISACANPGCFGTKTLVGMSFTQNNFGGGTPSADIVLGSGAKAIIDSADFAGDSDGTPTAQYAIFCNGAPGACDVRLGPHNWVSGSSSIVGFTNDTTSFNTILYGDLENYGNTYTYTGSNRVISNFQFNGFTLNNGSNNVIQCLGATASNDSGFCNFSTAGVTKVSIFAAGTSYFNGGNVAIGSTSASYRLDVTGDINTSGGYRINGVRSIAGTAPTISSGFGTSPSVTGNNGTSAFRINVGTGGTATNGVVGLPTAANGWNCFASDITTPATGHTIKQTATSTTSVTLTNYDNAGVAAAWAAGDIIIVNCMAY